MMPHESDRARILFLAHDPGYALAVQRRLPTGSRELRHAPVALTSLRLCYQWQPHLVVVEASQPEGIGWTLLDRLRELSDFPILLLTAPGSEVDRIAGFERGADDCVPVDTSPDELVMRIEALLRRVRRGTASPAEGRLALANGVVLDLTSRQAFKDGQPLALTSIERRLLFTLAAQFDQTVSHAALIAEVWGAEEHDRTDQLKMTIWRLRRKIEPDPRAPIILLSEYGLGYRLARAGD